MHDGHVSVTSAWSPASTIEHFGGDEKLARELIALFLNSCPRLLDNLRARLRDDDLAAVGKAAHALKGSISNYTTDGPARTALESSDSARRAAGTLPPPRCSGSSGKWRGS
jgi:hypothetical protein